MKPAELKARFPTEAALCTCLIDCLTAANGWEIYPETAGFDILAVWKATGHQLGIEAKLQLNAKVADQILPAYRSNSDQRGPDFRAVLVPCMTAANYGIARMLDALGVQVLVPDSCTSRWNPQPGEKIQREVHRHGLHQSAPWDTAGGALKEWWGATAWFDWNPTQRCELPEFVPKVAAGVPAPLQLTPWKVGALKVLADLELDGFTTAKGVRAHGVDPRRFCATDGWLKQLGGGKWARGTLPAFEDQHPEAYAQVLAQARAARAAAEGRSTLAPLGSSDIAGAVGYMRNPLEKHTALAVATRMGPAAIAGLSLAAYRQVAQDLRAMRPQPLDLGKAADRWRLRLVIYDAAHELVWPERRQPFAGLAKSAKMRKGNYIKAHRCASAVLQEALHGGRLGFRRALWSADS